MLGSLDGFENVDEEMILADLKAAAPGSVLWNLTSMTSSSTESCVSDSAIDDQPYMLKRFYNETNLKLSSLELKEKCNAIASQMRIADNDIVTVEEMTRTQSKSPLWFSVREGRMTASNFGKFMRRGSLTLSANDISSICYRQSSQLSVPSTNWGLHSEKTAKLAFHEHMCDTHENFSISECGFVISKEHPYLGATPDAIVNCDCHGTALLEVKCPYTLQNQPPEAAKYLIINGSTIELDRNCEYFAQVQGQMGIVGYKRCYFVVWTTVGIFVEEIVFDVQYYTKIVYRMNAVFRNFVLPELLTRSFLTMTDEKPSNVSFRCSCKRIVNDVRFILCSNINCQNEFYHYSCVGITRKPPGDWYCSTECCTNAH